MPKNFEEALSMCHAKEESICGEYFKAYLQLGGEERQEVSL